MDALTSILIISVFLVSIFIDDFSISKFFEEINKNNFKTQAYTERNKRTFFLRSFNLALPIFCGYYTIFYENLVFVTVVCFNLSFLLSFIYFNKKNKLKYFGFFFKFNKLYFLGFCTFIFYLNSPLIINLISLNYDDYAKVILQSLPLFNFFPVIFVTFFIDPLIANKIDNRNKTSELKKIHVSIRLLSRLFLAVTINFIYIFYG